MNHYESLKEHLHEIETDLEEDMTPFAMQIEQLNSIYGISTTASCAIIAEIGIDMKPFKTAEHICSWAGLCPGNNESAGKRKSASVTKGNPYIKSMLCEIAWVIAGKRNTYLSANSHFLRTAGPHSPDSPGHIKRTVLEISRAERGLRPANQYRALSQKAMPSQSVR